MRALRKRCSRSGVIFKNAWPTTRMYVSLLRRYATSATDSIWPQRR